MKNSIKLLLILISGCFILTGCSNDDDVDIADQYLTAKVDGVDFVAESKRSIKILRNTNDYGTNLYVKGMSTEGDFIEFSVYGYDGPGKYYFGDNYFNSSWIKYHQTSNLEDWESIMDLSNKSSFVEILFIDGNSMEGIFSFNGKSKITGISKIVSEGAFKANY